MTTVVSTISDRLSTTHAIGGCSHVTDEMTMETDVQTSSANDDVITNAEVGEEGQPTNPTCSDNGWLSQVLNQLLCQLGFADDNNNGGGGNSHSIDVDCRKSLETSVVSSSDSAVGRLMPTDDVIDNNSLPLQKISTVSGPAPIDYYSSRQDPTLMSFNNFTLDGNRQEVMSSYASEQFSKTLFDDLGGPGSALYADTSSTSVSGQPANFSFDFRPLSSISDDDLDLFDERFFTNDSVNGVVEFPVSLESTDNEENEVTLMLDRWFSENLDSLFVEQFPQSSFADNEDIMSASSDLASSAEVCLSSSSQGLETGSIYSSETNTSGSRLSRQSSFCSSISGGQPDDDYAVISGNASSVSAANRTDVIGHLSAHRAGGRAAKEQMPVRHASFGSPRDWYRLRSRRSSSSVSGKRKISGNRQEGASRSSTPGSSNDFQLSGRNSCDVVQKGTTRTDRPLTRHYSFGSSGDDSVTPQVPDEDFDELSTLKRRDSEFMRLLLDRKGPSINSKYCKSSVDDDNDSGLGRNRRYENSGTEGSNANLRSICSKQRCHPVVSLLTTVPLNGLPTTNETEAKRRTLVSLPGSIGKTGNGFGSRRRFLEDHCYFVRSLQTDHSGVSRAGVSKRKRRSSAPGEGSAGLQGLKVGPMLSVLINAQQSRTAGKTRTKSQVSDGDGIRPCHSYLELFLRSTGPLSANQGSDFIASEKLGQFRVGAADRVKEPSLPGRVAASDRRTSNCSNSTHRSACKNGSSMYASELSAGRSAGSQPRLLHRLLTENQLIRDDSNVCLTADNAIDDQFDTPCSDYQQTLDDNLTTGAYMYDDVIAAPCAGDTDQLLYMFDSVQMEPLDETLKNDCDWWTSPCLG